MHYRSRSRIEGRGVLCPVGKVREFGGGRSAAQSKQAGGITNGQKRPCFGDGLPLPCRRLWAQGGQGRQLAITSDKRIFGTWDPPCRGARRSEGAAFAAARKKCKTQKKGKSAEKELAYFLISAQQGSSVTQLREEGVLVTVFNPACASSLCSPRSSSSPFYPQPNGKNGQGVCVKLHSIVPILFTPS